MNRRIGTMAVVLLGTGLGSASIAFAGQPAPTGTMHVDPSTVEPGDSYVISSDPESPCFLGEVTGDTGGIRPGAWSVEPAQDGSWEVTIEVPANGPPDAHGNPTPFPEGEYDQHAFCQQPNTAGFGRSAGRPAAPSGEQAPFTYEPVTVTVVAPEEPTEPPAEPPAEEPPAAQPATETPDFTG